MRSFLKFFLAAFLALVIFVFIAIFFIVGFVAGLATTQKEETGAKAVLVLNLDMQYHERTQQNLLTNIGEGQHDLPGVYELTRLIEYAKHDSAIKGIYVNCDGNPNGFATSEEIRNALIDFKTSRKFVYAFGDVIPQKAYYVANVADKIYCNPKGGVEWKGLAAVLTFLKGALDKLEIEPQIFYAGKFKSATEPLREYKMTDANKLQTTEILNDLFDRMLSKSAQARSLDTGVLRKCVNEHLIRYASDALQYHLVDGLKYDDQVKNEIKSLLKIGIKDKINFVSMSQYAETEGSKYRGLGEDRIALIYAEGDIIGGRGDQEQIGGDAYRMLIAKARTDKNVKAVVLRINSGGGSALVSEDLWREISITRKEKPFVISFGDVAASGAYYLSCNADSIFAEPNTITGSIGVFSILPNMQRFFKDKLGVTFDGVKTAPDADALTITKPLTPMQKRYLQDQVDTIYNDFKSRVAHGRNMSMAFVDSIGQGRIWSGERALRLGLVDRLGSVQDAVECAARLAKTTNYRLKEYPEPKNFIDLILGNYKKSAQTNAIREEIGDEQYKIFQRLQSLKSMIGSAQTRMPYELDFE